MILFDLTAQVATACGRALLCIDCVQRWAEGVFRVYVRGIAARRGCNIQFLMNSSFESLGQADSTSMAIRRFLTGCGIIV
jgi:hypothetical protein